MALVTTLDQADQFDWSRADTYYRSFDSGIDIFTPNGIVPITIQKVVQVSYFFDDGSTTHILFDPDVRLGGDRQEWSTWQVHHDPAGAIEWTHVGHDDGTASLAYYDTGSPDSWSRIDYHLNAQSQVDLEVVTYDDGVVQTTYHDPLNEHPWSAVTYDGRGSVAFHYDDGSWLYTAA